MVIVPEVISALAQRSGIHQIERIIGVRRDAIMRLGVPVGEGARAVDRRPAVSYTSGLKMNALTAMRYSYCSFTYRYPYGVAATVKRMRAGVEWM